MSRFRTFVSAQDTQGSGLTSQRARDHLVALLRESGIRHPQVLEVLRTLPRHLFLDEALASRAYENISLPIGLGQTISQPWVVARMSEVLLERQPHKILEIGTGSGYQAAVLSCLVEQVYTVERIEDLLRQARRRFRALKLQHIRSRHDDGRLGWPDEAPFDAIIVTAAGESVPPELLAQLSPRGVLLGPFGPPGDQKLMRYTVDNQGQAQGEELASVSFVPLLGGVL